MASHDLSLAAGILPARQAKGHARPTWLGKEEGADDGGDRAWPTGDKAWPARLGAVGVVMGRGRQGRFAVDERRGASDWRKGRQSLDWGTSSLSQFYSFFTLPVRA
ncbi:hypothetical protein D1007_02028 [Hordeum vulgare]|nr:hypothetical protein D1007_02028 [Hordeum vulgare]